MFRIPFIIISLIVSLLLPCQSVAQEVSFSAQGAQGMLLKKDESMAELIKAQSSRYYALSAMWRAKGDSVSLDDEIWGRPTLEGGLMLGDFHSVKLSRENLPWLQDVNYYSGLGYMITPYAAFRRPLIRSRKIEAGYKFENGLGINTRTYNPETNVNNELIGCPVSVFIGLGGFVSWRITPNLALGLEATFRHYSNGKLNQPNVGINTVDAGLKATYTVEPDTVVRTPYKHGWNRDFKKHLYADFSVSWCPQTLLCDWLLDWYVSPEERVNSYKLYSAWAASGALMWRYNRKFASGIGFDYTYVPFTDDIQKSEIAHGRPDNQPLSKHVMGLSLHHEAFYKNVSMHASIGYLLKRSLGSVMDDNQTPVYETIGLRWYMPFLEKRMYLGYNINACAFKANHFQFAMGFCPWK